MTTKKLKVSNVPNLRFPEFDGEWETKKLGEVCEIKTGNKDTQNKIEDGKYPFFVRSNTVERIDSYSYDGEAILTSGDGVGVGKNFHYINGKFDFHQRVYALRNFQKGYCGKYIYQLFSEKFYDRVRKLSAKNSVDSVRMDMISAMKICFPPFLEQQKIASFLRLVDDRIATQNKIIKELGVSKTTFAKRIFSRLLRFKNDNGNDYPEWEVKRLNQICYINPKTKSIPNTFYYIDLESVVDGRLLKEEQILKDSAPSRAQRVLEKNDVLFQMVRPYQKNNLFFDKEGDYVASTGYAQIRTEQNPQFIFQYLHNQTFVDKVIERCTGTSYPAISSNDLGSIEIDYPTLPEQTKIANFLSSVDSKIDVESQLLKRLEEQKKFLLQQMFV